MKFYWTTAIAIHLCIVYGYFYARKAALSSCDWTYGPQSLKYYLILHSKAVSLCSALVEQKGYDRQK